jgi:transcriptional regulator with XRE-family HTH domain/predicted XRE-type DNA-binding protein
MWGVAGTRKNEEERRRLIGRRIRRRRLFLNLTQAALAKSLGVTYQQLQKYEKGANRISQARLDDLANLLDVAPDYFLVEEVPAAADALEQFLESPDGIALNRAVAGVPDGARARLILAIAAYCDSRIRTEDAETAALAAWLKKMSGRNGGAESAGDAKNTVRAAKVILARLFGKTIRDRRMTQLFAGQILHSDQAKISTIARGDVRGVSLEKLLRFLVLLGWNVRIDLARRPADQDGKIEIILRDS